MEIELLKLFIVEEAAAVAEGESVPAGCAHIVRLLSYFQHRNHLCLVLPPPPPPRSCCRPVCAAVSLACLQCCTYICPNALFSCTVSSKYACTDAPA